MTVPRWPYPNGHRFTKSECRRVRDAVNSYGYRWGLRPIAPFHDTKRAVHATHTDSGYNGWELLYAEIRPVRHLPALKHEKGGAAIETWFALRSSGWRPIVDESADGWGFRPESAPLDYVHEIEPLPTRRAIAAISRWTWCRGCDAELAVTREGWCAWCVVAPVALSADDLRPIGAPLGYTPPVTL
jgi:hypothetical protein